MRSADLAVAADIRESLRSGAAREQRKAARISAADVARVLRVTPQAVSYWETGRKAPSVRHALAYGRVLARHCAGKEAGMSESAGSHFPIEIPEYVKARCRTFFKPDPADILSRPAQMFGGKSAIWFVADGDGTWDDVLGKYEAMLSWQVPI